MAEFFSNFVDVLTSFFEGVKVVDTYEEGIRLFRGAVVTKRLRDSKIRLREKIRTKIYEANDLDIEKNQLERILEKERDEMIAKGKLLPDKGQKNQLEKVLEKDHDEMIAKGKLLPGQNKPSWEKGRTSILKSWNPLVRPEYGPNFRSDFWGRANHKDRYTAALPSGAYFLIPERYFNLMRVAVLPINSQTMDIKEINVSVTDHDKDIGSIGVGLRLTFLVIDVEKAYITPTQYNYFLYTKAEQYLAELAKNHTYDYWKSESRVDKELAKEIDRNLASGLISGVFKESNPDGSTDGPVLSHNKKIVPYDMKRKPKNIDDLVDSRNFYENGTFMRSNTSILAVKLKTALNYELMKDYGILITSVGIIEGVPVKPQRVMLSGHVMPDTLNINTTSEKPKSATDYDS